MMQKIDYIDAQSKLAKTMRQVCEEGTPVTINGAGKDQVVMMPLETFLKLNRPTSESLENSPYMSVVSDF
jgi:PHD/YefM family antitoxin component YafN of YafNO toxin-antitoxin module